MKRLVSIVLTALVGAMLTTSVWAGQVNQDTYKKLYPTYNRSDGWYLDSSYNFHQIVNGSTVGNLSAAGTIWTAANGGTISNATNSSWIFGENSEDLRLAFTANALTLSSSTGVVSLDLGAISTTLTLASGQTLESGTDNAFILGDNSEKMALTFTANTMTLSSSTGIVAFDFGALSTTLTFANGQTIGTGTNNAFIFGDNSEDLVLTFGANLATFSSSTGVATVDFGTLNIETDGTIQVLGSGATIGWTAASAANTACATTCAGTGACVMGYDVGGSTFVDCASALADTCMCAGPAS